LLTKAICKKAKSYVDIGITPHIISKNKKADVLNGVDKTLELARETLK